jgi:hypothetical protein
MMLNTLPPEILERIFEFTNKDIFKCALVCRKWASLANPIIWKGVTVHARGWSSRDISFTFYRKIINPDHSCAQYIRKLTLDSVIFWPVCIGKILQACPGIVELKILHYMPNKTGNRIDLLKYIAQTLPNLRRLDLSYSHRYFGEDNIQRLIDSKKSFHIKVTRKCPLNREKIIGYYEEYDSSTSKKWQCHEKSCPNFAEAK